MGGERIWQDEKLKVDTLGRGDSYNFSRFEKAVLHVHVGAIGGLVFNTTAHHCLGFDPGCWHGFTGLSSL
jgi:hypothetical protein